MKSYFAGGLCMVLAGLGAGGCKHKGESQGMATPGANQSAIQSIAQARCQREARCDNVGTGKKYDSPDACITAINHEWQDELNAFACPGGVFEDRLNACLEAVRSENCANPFDTLGRIYACRSNDICNPQP